MPSRPARRFRTSKPARGQSTVLKTDHSRRAAYLFRLHLDPPHESSRVPVEERHAPLTLHSEQHTTCQTLGLETNIDSTRLLNKVLVELDAGGGFANGKIIAVVLRGPHKVQGRAKGLIPPCQRSV